MVNTEFKTLLTVEAALIHRFSLTWHSEGAVKGVKIRAASVVMGYISLKMTPIRFNHSYLRK